MVDMLLKGDAGILVEIKDAKGRTPLTMAAIGKKTIKKDKKLRSLIHDVEFIFWVKRQDSDQDLHLYMDFILTGQDQDQVYRDPD